MQRLDFLAMGCQMLALADSGVAEASEALTQVPVWFEEWEASLSRFRESSELSALNRSAGKWVRVGETMWQVILEALRAAGDSHGLVTPAVLDQLETAGYDRTFESLDPSLESSDLTTKPVLDWRAIEIDTGDHRVRIPEGMHLDLGGITKGWAAQQAAQRLSLFAPALVDAGGDIAISAARANGDQWPIAVADPFGAELDLSLLMIAEGGVATSGRDYRRWKRNGKWQHHIIDPRTGAPAATDVLSATILAPTTTAAEVAAKVALIPITFTFYFRRRIGTGMWRAIHYVSFIGFAFITAHGLLSGSDTNNWAVFGMYILTGASFLFLTFYRIFSMDRVMARE